jgi:lysozyme family protein
MLQNFPRAAAVTLDYEGGNDDDPHDPGGRTSRGITQREWDRYRRAHSGTILVADVWRAPQSAVLDIYRTDYWQPVAGDSWPVGLDLCVYDAGVNSGPGRALTWAKAALAQQTGTFASLAAQATMVSDKVAVIKRYQKRRLGFLEGLRTWRYFGRGWARRVAGIEAIATRWALAGAGKPPELVAEHLQQEAKKSSAVSKASASSAVAAPAGTGTVATAYQHTDWTAWTIDAAIVIVVVAAVVWLVYLTYKHRVRSQAFAEASK